MRKWVMGMATLLAWSGTAHGFSGDPASVFINELHCDNAGGDRNEAVEIAGRAGRNQAGWCPVLYNGSTGRVYATIPLAATLVDQGAGVGTLLVRVSQNSLQNGPDVDTGLSISP